MSLVKKWQDYGISGWKEDFDGYGGYGLRDDKVDPTNDRLMAQHQPIIPASETPFTVHVTGLPPDTPWSTIQVTDHAGHIIPVSPSGHAFTFTLVPGESNQARATPKP